MRRKCQENNNINAYKEEIHDLMKNVIMNVSSFSKALLKGNPTLAMMSFFMKANK